ncbi:unnamed protein product [marine sediment metagenome]|uniref:Uncharacterized protein n=1 Tax=marine sediment metagenome TaxID=412755 RepID=X0TPA8_9ZZZZ
MIINKNIDLKNFEFWSGAKDLADLLTLDELEQIEFNLEDLFHDKTPSETDINDLFWFEEDFICEMIGTTSEEVFNREIEK